MGSASVGLFLAGMAALSLLMVLAMAPMSLELIRPSADAAEHRRRVRGLGAVGVFTEWLARLPLAYVAPRRFWTGAYVALWAGILALCVAFLRAAEADAVERPDPATRTRNLVLLFAVPAGFWAVHAAIVWLARALDLANARPPAPARARTDAPRDSLRRPPSFAGGARLRGDSRLEPEAEAPPDSRKPSWRGRAGSLLWVLGVLLFVGIADDAGPRLRGIRQWQAFLDQRRGPLLAGAGALTAAGFVLFMGGILHLVLRRGRPMSRAEIEAMRGRQMIGSRPRVASAARYRLRGLAVGRGASETFTLTQLKAACRSGAWRRDPDWRRRIVVCVGAFTMAAGMVALVVVNAGFGVQVLVGATAAFVGARMVWALARA